MVDSDTLDYEILTGFADVPPEHLPMVMSRLLTSRPSSFLGILKFKLDDRCKKKGIEAVSRLLCVSREFLNLVSAEAQADNAWEESYEREKMAASQASISPSLVKEVVTMFSEGKLELSQVVETCGITEELFNQWLDLYTGTLIEARDSDVYTREFREKLCQEYIIGEINEQDMEVNFGVLQLAAVWGAAALEGTRGFEGRGDGGVCAGVQGSEDCRQVGGTRAGWRRVSGVVHMRVKAQSQFPEHWVSTPQVKLPLTITPAGDAARGTSLLRPLFPSHECPCFRSLRLHASANALCSLQVAMCESSRLDTKSYEEVKLDSVHHFCHSHLASAAQCFFLL